MLPEAQKRKGIEQFQYQILRDVLKVEGDRMKEFVTKYLEVKVKTSRKKVTDTFYMGSVIFSRQRYRDAQVRRDLDGRYFFQESHRTKDSRGRDYFRKYYRTESENPRDFFKDACSLSMSRLGGFQ